MSRSSDAMMRNRRYVIKYAPLDVPAEGLVRGALTEPGGRTGAASHMKED